MRASKGIDEVTEVEMLGRIPDGRAPDPQSQLFLAQCQPNRGEAPDLQPLMCWPLVAGKMAGGY